MLENTKVAITATTLGFVRCLASIFVLITMRRKKALAFLRCTTWIILIESFT